MKARVPAIRFPYEPAFMDSFSSLLAAAHGSESKKVMST